MILLIGGSTHTGKTLAAQRVLEKYSYPYLSIDHLKMGLIRSGICPFSPESPDEELTPFLWGIIKEIVKTAIENGQNLVVEGCYIPFDWKKDFTQACRSARWSGTAPPCPTARTRCWRSRWLGARRRGPAAS